jgi:hypothetical protein
MSSIVLAISLQTNMRVQGLALKFGRYYNFLYVYIATNTEPVYTRVICRGRKNS